MVYVLKKKKKQVHMSSSTTRDSSNAREKSRLYTAENVNVKEAATSVVAVIRDHFSLCRRD